MKIMARSFPKKILKEALESLTRSIVVLSAPYTEDDIISLNVKMSIRRKK